MYTKECCPVCNKPFFYLDDDAIEHVVCGTRPSNNVVSYTLLPIPEMDRMIIHGERALATMPYKRWQLR